jgi:hypothetical protein
LLVGRGSGPLASDGEEISSGYSILVRDTPATGANVSLSMKSRNDISSFTETAIRANLILWKLFYLNKDLIS